MAQQDETKAIIPKHISYHYSCEKYINKYLLSFSMDDAEKFDLFPNKNSKYLFYKFNDQIEALGGEKHYLTYCKSERFHQFGKKLKSETDNF